MIYLGKLFRAGNIAVETHLAETNAKPSLSKSLRRPLPTGRASTRLQREMKINYLMTDSSKLRHLITRRSPMTETQQPIDRKWSVNPILRSIQIYAGIAVRFDRKSDLRRAMKPGPCTMLLNSKNSDPKIHTSTHQCLGILVLSFSHNLEHWTYSQMKYQISHQFTPSISLISIDHSKQFILNFTLISPQNSCLLLKKGDVWRINTREHCESDIQNSLIVI